MVLNKILTAMIMLFAVMAMSVSAFDGDINEVKLDNDVLNPEATNDIYQYERGDTFEVKVRFTATESAEDVTVRASLSGVHNEDVSDESDTFRVTNGTSYTKRLNLKFPDRMDQADYTLIVEIRKRTGAPLVEYYTLQMETARNNVVIRDVLLSPAGVVQAGRALLISVRVRNPGLEDENSVKVTVSIPDLGLSASDYIEKLDGSVGGDMDATTSEEMYLRIQACAEAATYTMYIEVEYDDGDKTVSTTRTITVTEGDLCPVRGEEPGVPADESAKTIITIGSTAQNVARGQGGVAYPITITNYGIGAASYTVAVDATSSWATVQLSPSNMVTVPAGGTSTVYVYVSANENAALGENMFSVMVSKGNELLENIPMKAYVTEGGASAGVSVTGDSTWGGLKQALEIALVVLVVLLVVFGLIVGFNKLRGGDKGDEDEEGKTYY